ncbi:MAG: trypsin-like peptidase domain-containing protein, partial [Planctomycetia bacterium]|nr:trypsin-like peptidase domain-containing protein [Planctomycetia bacterium]
MERNRLRVRPGAALAVALAVAVPVLGPAPASGKGPKEAETLSAGFRKAARAVLPAVVTVRSTNPRRLFLPPPQDFVPFPGRFGPDAPPPTEDEGGSGVVIDAGKGLVLTNDHVVNDATRVVVVLHDGRERPVSQVRRDPKSDLALLVIDAKGPTQAEWGDSEALDTGDWVLAVGQPFGISGTVTAGIVSGKGRGVGVSVYEDLLQTDAAINPGNSGGPLVDLDGRVVGINTVIKTRRGGYEGVGFAVPAARARRVAADLAGSGSVRRAFLGVAIGPVDRAAAEKLEQPGAVVINGVSPGSPAEKAGLKRGDVITRLGGQPVRGLGPLQSAIEFAEIGAPITLTVDRDGKSLEVNVSPEAQPERFGLAETVAPVEVRPDAPARQEEFRALGLRLSETDPRLARRFRLRETARGLVVT